MPQEIKKEYEYVDSGYRHFVIHTAHEILSLHTVRSEELTPAVITRLQAAADRRGATLTIGQPNSLNLADVLEDLEEQAEVWQLIARDTRNEGIS